MKIDPIYDELIAEQRAEVNRLNAQRSTGPISHQGKAISSLNAVKTGLTGRTVLLHSDDAAVYQQHLSAYAKEYQPIGLREQELVQSLADTQWRLQRIPGLEMAIYAHGRAENQEYCDRHPTTGASLIELGTFLKYEKQLRNLQLQESRLRRRYETEIAELRSLQKERKENEKTAAAPNKSGFVFSNPKTEPRTMPASPQTTAAPNQPALLKTA